MDCLPLFFSQEQVVFISVDEGDVGIRTLLQLGVDSLPTFQVAVPSPDQDKRQLVSLKTPHQLRSMVRRVGEMTGFEPCDTLEFSRASLLATCPAITLIPEKGHSSADGVSAALRDPDAAERASRCLQLLDEEEPPPARDRPDALALVAAAFLTVRFGFWAVGRARRRGGGEDHEAEAGAPQPPPQPADAAAGGAAPQEDGAGHNGAPAG